MPGGELVPDIWRFFLAYFYIEYGGDAFVDIPCRRIGDKLHRFYFCRVDGVDAGIDAIAVDKNQWSLAIERFY